MTSEAPPEPRLDRRGLLVLLLKRFARAHPVAQAGESEPAAPHLEEELDRELSRLDD